MSDQIIDNQDGTVTKVTVIPESTQEVIVDPRGLQSKIEQLNVSKQELTELNNQQNADYQVQIAEIDRSIAGIQAELDSILAVVPNILN